MVLADGRPGADHSQHEKEKAGNLQPQHVGHATNAFCSNASSAIEGAYPAIFAGLASGHTQRGTSLAAEAGCARGFVFSGCRHTVQRRILAASRKAFRAECIGVVTDADAMRRSSNAHLDGIVDQQLKKLMKELGEAINQAVAESDEISDVMARIKAGGHDVFLVLEATIGFNQRESSADPAPQNEFKSTGELEITSQDLKFLRSMRIAVNDKR